MILNYYSVKDIKSGEFGQVFTSPNNDTATREYLTALQDERTMMNKYPQDFELFYLFAIDSLTGKIVDNNTQFVTNAIIAKKTEVKNDEK